MATMRIKAASMTVFANDTQLDRVQTFGSTARLDSEDIKEIGNIDIVEVVDNVPTVDITLDANQYGSIKTLRKLAQKNVNWGTVRAYVSGSTSVSTSSGVFFFNEKKYLTSGVVTTELSGYYPTGATQHNVVCLSVATGAPNTIVVTSAAAVATSATPTVPATPAGSLRLADISLVTDASSGKTALTYLNIVNNHQVLDTASLTTPDVIQLKDFETAIVDFACPVKEAGDNTTSDPVNRTMYTANAFVNRYDAAFSVNGLATESWSCESDNKSWFLNTAAIVYTDRFTGTTSAQTLTYTPTQRDNLNYALRCWWYSISGGTYTEKVEGTDFSIAATTLTWLTGNPAADQVQLVRYLTSSGAIANLADPMSGQPFMQRNPGAVDAHPVVAGGLRHGQVEVYLSDDETNHVLRLQSVSISSSLTREPLYEIGHKRAYFRTLTFPIPITMQVEATASDLQEYARLNNKTFATAKELSIDWFRKDLNLIVKIYREDDTVRATAPWVSKQPIKTLTVQSVTLTDEGNELRVDGNGTQTFGLKANTNLIIRGRV